MPYLPYMTAHLPPKLSVQILAEHQNNVNILRSGKNRSFCKLDPVNSAKKIIKKSGAIWMTF